VRWFDNLKVGTKLMVGFLTVSAITAVVGLTALGDMSEIEGLNDKMYQHELLGLSHTKQANIQAVATAVALRDILLASPGEARNTAIQQYSREKALFATRLDSARALTFTSEGKAQLAQIESIWQEYDVAGSAVAEALRNGGSATSPAMVEKIQLAQARMVSLRQEMRALSASRESEASKAAAEGLRIYERSRLLVIFLVAGSVLGGIVIGIFIARRLASGLKQVAERAEQLRTRAMASMAAASEAMARGDLTATVSVDVDTLGIDSRDEIGDLARSMDGMIAETHTTASAFERALGTLREVIHETDTVIQAAQAGRLGERGEAAKFAGGYRQLVDGLNRTLEAVVTPVKEAQEVLERVAERDLTARVAGQYNGDHAKLKDALNTAVVNLEEALSEVAAASGQVAAASGQISSGSQSLAEGTSEQASSLEEVSASLQELASMTRQNASNAQQARGLAEGAQGSASMGVESMRRLSAAIDKIKESSDSTAKIVKTIDEIAFQTNLLALNAAVEAARAGDAGKGFAVVAEEVRNLAMRSAEAAKNTAALIEEAVRNADNGVGINNEVLANLNEINEQIVKVGAVMTEVAVASDQQQQGVDQITTAVEQMNGVTQQAAANSEESAATAEELNGQADRLRDLVGQFVLSTNSSRPASAARSASFAAPATPRHNGGHGNGNGHAAGNGNGNGKKHNASGKSWRSNGAHSRQLVPSATPLSPEELIPFGDEADERTLSQF
jgi:methyl-accepting chemotaxis protein